MWKFLTGAAAVTAVAIAASAGPASAQVRGARQLVTPPSPVAEVQARWRGPGWRGCGWRGCGWGWGYGWRRGWWVPGAVVGGVVVGSAIGAAAAGAYPYGYPAYAYPEQAYPGQAYPQDGDAEAYCSQRYRSYDPASGTYLGYDGIRHPCP
jgi:hypothetical protein